MTEKAATVVAGEASASESTTNAAATDVTVTVAAVTVITVSAVARSAGGGDRNADSLWNKLANSNFDFFLDGLRNANFVGLGANFRNALVNYNVNGFFLSGVLNNVASSLAGFGFANSLGYLASLGFVDLTSNLGGYGLGLRNTDVLGNLLGAGLGNEIALANFDFTNFVAADRDVVGVGFFAMLWLVRSYSDVFGN